MSNTAVLETVPNEKAGHIILSYNISLLLHVLLFTSCCKNNKLLFYDKCWEPRMCWFSCLEGKNCNVSGTCSGNIIKISSCFLKQVQYLEGFWGVHVCMIEQKSSASVSVTITSALCSYQCMTLTASLHLQLNLC